TPETNTTRKPVKPAPRADEVPWAKLLSPDVASHAVEDVAWRSPADGRTDEFPPLEFRRWFSSIPGRPWQVTDETQRNMKYTKFDGQAKLKAPWIADAVLRLAIYDAEKCSLFFWRGNEGVRFRYYHTRTPQQIAAHHVSRNGPQAKPEIGPLIAHDNGRWQRSFLGPFEIRHENDQLMLVRGDLPLLSVSYEGPPEEVIVEGKLKFRHCTMYRSDPLPREHIARFEMRPGDNQLPVDKPGEMEWSMLDEKSESASLNIDPAAGTVELRAGATDKVDAISVTPLGSTGLSEFVFRVDQADPGTGLVLMGNATPVYRVGFEWDSNGSRLAVAQQTPTARVVEKAFDPNSYPVPWIAKDQWYRILVGAGTMSLWTSEDGSRWSWVGDTTYRSTTAPVTAIGLFALMGGERGITLSHLERREFPTLYSLADPELRALVEMKGFGSTAILDIGTWLQHVIQCQPKGVHNFKAWRRACAVETLRAGSNGPLATALLNGLLTETLASADIISGQGEFDDRFLWQLLGEASQTLDVFDSTMGLRFSHVVHESIRRRVLHQLARTDEPAEGEPTNVEAAESADAPLPAGSVAAAGMAEFLMLPFWSQQATLLTPQSAAQLELMSLVQHREDERVRKLLDRLTYWNTSSHPAQAWWTPLATSYSTMAWSELTAHRSLDNEQQIARAWPSRWKTALAPIRHPLAQTVSKEAYNVMAEFQAAISGRAFQDACQVISSSATSDLLGLLPDREDDRLMVSFPNAVSLAMNQHPDLRSSMNEKFGAVGRLRVRQAIENGDADTIEAATVQFFGTVAAAESARWLGDQALAAGRFAAARGHYRAALADYRLNLSVETEETAALESRLRMTEAILGFPPEIPVATAPGETPPADRPVNFGGVEMTSAQFAELATELRTAGQASQTAAGIHGVRAASSAWHVSPSVLPPGGYELQQRLQIQGDVGEHAGKSGPADVNWFARQNVVEVDGVEAFFSNRFQLTRIDLNTGKETWRQELGAEHGSVNYWPHLAMRPLLTASRVFCRRLTKTGPELICCDRAAGTVLWRFKPASGATLLVSDPLLVRDRLQILSQTTDATGPG
ncbi:MAG: PQQ-binding-like beta-propeller repeat protein, partial [Planctomycetes bacterium]|nr:PQQ-binding-like beta-propeller repeat protein [Planctomycetota bacterium]